MTSSIQELLNFGWQKTKGDFWFLFLVQVACLIVTAAISYRHGAVSGILSGIVGVLMSVSVITLVLRMADGSVGTWHDLFAKYGEWRIFLNYLLASLAAVVMVVVGLALCILPGIYIGLRLAFYKFLVVDKGDIGPIAALKESFAMTRGVFWNLFGLTVAVIVLNMVGLLLLGAGLFITLPVTMFAYAKLYRELGTRLSLAPRAA